MSPEQLPNNQGYDELERLGKRLRDYGRLQFVSMEHDPRSSGPTLYIYHKHVPMSVIAAPGSLRSKSDVEPSSSWQVYNYRKGGTPETNSVGLTNITVNLPGEIAAWALATQRNIINEGKFSGEDLNSLHIELSAAEHFVDKYDGPDYSYWGDRALR